MHSLKLQVGARTLVARCDPSLHIQAESVLRLFGDLGATGTLLQDGARIPLGWSQLSLRARDGQLVICEPHFDGDPLAELREDITRTLSVLVDQTAITQRLGVATQPTAFHQHLTVAFGVLAQPQLLLERKRPPLLDDSGWYIGPMEPGETECVTMRVYELLRIRPALVSVLALPTGSLVTFDGDSITTVLDELDAELWKPS